MAWLENTKSSEPLKIATSRVISLFGTNNRNYRYKTDSRSGLYLTVTIVIFDIPFALCNYKGMLQ